MGQISDFTLRLSFKYVQSAFRFGEKDIDADMFGTRHDYLDRLPPFNASSASLTAKEIVLDAESPEFWCQNTLLKLQSLLCCTAIEVNKTRHQSTKESLEKIP